jgi:hypothetical protein
MAILIHSGGVEVSKVTSERGSYHIVYEVNEYVGSLSVTALYKLIDEIDALAPAVVTAIGKILISSLNVGNLLGVSVSVCYIVIYVSQIILITGKVACEISSGSRRKLTRVRVLAYADDNVCLAPRIWTL